MPWLVPLVAMLSLLQQPSPQRARQDTLRLPRALHHGEAAMLAVTLGGSRSEEITVRDGTGQLIGVISPFGRRQSSAGSTYLLPVPADAIVRGRVVVRFSIEHEGEPTRAPRRSQIGAVRLRVRPAVR
jgi:hypothetical protein